MSAFLSHLHRQLRDSRKGGARSDIPESQHKTYPRMEQVVLPPPSHIDTSLEDVLRLRHSAFPEGRSDLVSTADLATLLGHALKMRVGSTHRPHPSGGALFPIETYICAPRLSDVAPGIFHYDPSRHALERLWDFPSHLKLEGLVRGQNSTPWEILIVFTSVWERSETKYHEFGYILSLLETGHMSQNMLLVAKAMGFASRPFASFDDEQIIETLDLEQLTEQPVHTIMLSKPRVREN